MKAFFCISVLLLTIPIVAQKAIVKEFDYNNQQIEIQFEDVDHIEIVHSDEEKIKITMQDYAENFNRLKVETSENIITISTSKLAPFREGLKTEKYCYEQPLFPTYKLTLPKGCTIDIIYDNGNFSTTNFIGNLNLNLNKGDVNIKHFSGNINAELFSGNLEATFNNTIIDVLSNKGKISTTFSSSKMQKTAFSLKGVLGVEKNELTVQSINANIVLNYTSTQ